MIRLKYDRLATPDLFYKIGVQLGDSTELRVGGLLREISSQPKWFRGWRQTGHCTPEDLKGIDFVISTDKGPIFLQVKASVSNAREFQFFHKNARQPILLIVVLPSEDDSVVKIKLLHLLQEQYNQM